MAEPLKSFFSKELVQDLADSIVSVYPNFPASTFVARVIEGLAERELLARAEWIAEALREALPASYPEALAILLRSLGPEHQQEELLGQGMAPFFYLPHVLFVGRFGLSDFDASMMAQMELTKRFTAEWSIRHFIDADPIRTFDYLERWSTSANAHVRRLVSEGTRLRLPWGKRVRWLDENPEAIVKLLDALVDDPTPLVRRSVANNLNDMTKVHPELAFATCRRWAHVRTDERYWVIEHALRSAVKRGDREALSIVGFGREVDVAVRDVHLAPSPVTIGERLHVHFTLTNGAAQPAAILVDLVVHFVKANGTTSPKTFKVGRATLPSLGDVRLAASVSFARHTTRTPYAGRHVLEVLVNGTRYPLGSVQVEPSRVT